MSKLKTCPFCGAHGEYRGIVARMGSAVHEIGCVCFCIHVRAMGKEKVYELWNTRTPKLDNSRIAAAEAERDTLKCCGNCGYFNMKYELTFCKKQDSENENYHIDDEGIISTLKYDASACKHWRKAIGEGC